MKLVKDTMKKHSLRFFKKEYLNTPITIVERRRLKFKELRSLGMPPYKAYQKSRR